MEKMTSLIFTSLSPFSICTFPFVSLFYLWNVFYHLCASPVTLPPLLGILSRGKGHGSLQSSGDYSVNRLRTQSASLPLGPDFFYGWSVAHEDLNLRVTLLLAV